MRLLELKLTEAGLEPKEFRSRPWRKDFFISKIVAGKPFELIDGSTVIVDKNEAVRIKSLFDADQINAVGLIKTDKGNFLLSKFQKTEEFKREPIAGQEGDGDAATDKISNRGDVSEGILSAALFAKLAARSQGKILDISESDLWAVVDNLREVGTDRYSLTVKDAAKAVVNDELVFTVILPKPAYLDFVNPAKRSLLTQEASSAVLFANSEDNKKFSEYFYLNGKPDMIEIICDGGNTAKQKVSKVDIEVVVTDRLTGKKNRKRLNISLKANAKQFGQVGVGSEAKVDFFEKQQTLWGKFGIDLTPIEKKFNSALKKSGVAAAVAVAYQYAAAQLNTLLSGDNDEEEYLYLKDLANGINYYATLNTPNVLLVNFKAGGYEVMSFDAMEPKLKSVNLAAKYNKTVKWPQVEVFDSNSGEQLFQVRLKMTADERRNYIEKGSLMSKLLGTTVKPVKVKKK